MIYIIELTKFNVIDFTTTLNIFKGFIEDFLGYNLDLICIFIDNVGKYLFNNPETSKRFKYLLDFLSKVKKSKG